MPNEEMPELSKAAIAKRQERAAILDSTAHELERENDTLWVKRAKVWQEVADTEAWRYMPKPGPYASLNDWRESVRIPRSTFHETVRTYEILKPLGDKTLGKMKKENAKRLAKLPESKRKNEKIIEQAQTLGEDKFTEIANKYSPGAATPEGRVTLSITCYTSQKKVIEEAIETFASRHTLDEDDKARVLELICADAVAVTDRVREIFPEQTQLWMELAKLYRSNLALDEVHVKILPLIQRALALIESVGVLIPGEPAKKAKAKTAA